MPKREFSPYRHAQAACAGEAAIDKRLGAYRQRFTGDAKYGQPKLQCVFDVD